MRSFLVRICVVSLLMLCLNLTGNAQTGVARPSSLKNVKRIVCLGDSITQGGEAPGGYVWLFRRYLQALYGTEIEVFNAGISGHRSNDMYLRFQRDVMDKKPDLITISVGVNDVWHGFYDNNPDGNGPRGIPLPEYRKNLEMMIGKAKEAKARVVLLASTMIYENLDGRENHKLEMYNKELKDLAKQHGLLYVDFQRPMQSMINNYRRATSAKDNLLTTDGVHMNPLGNRVMAYTMLTAMGVKPEARERVREVVERGRPIGK